jgi:hypothetical protein
MKGILHLQTARCHKPDDGSLKDFELRLKWVMQVLRTDKKRQLKEQSKILASLS